MRDRISYRDNHLLSIQVDEIASAAPTFSTKNAAIKAGSEFGWRAAVRIERRFETVWMVGKKEFQDDNSAGLQFDAYRFPLLKWVKENGVEKCPVLSVRRYKQELRNDH
ncbi:hypothetical protein [Citrobacter sp. RHBSTW-00881]|uniref:hypothetical protein n=1 Tax=Citrobacter sp. RHBSTW-00881 TaxID=2742667 RepID=UPI0015EAE30A|nr:hypothetical protein [Citrobacter sp. RHBSTW-00881]QLS66703.1 hypothetical protein HV311_19815 [Citrobacter sp. RHBSTW-00881]